MKMISLYFREKTLEHFGKKGTSWHGSMVHTVQLGENENEEISKQDGKELENFMVTYYDHISSSDTKQDWQAVLSIIEALLCKIEVDFPEVERVIIQSDNARCYQNSMLLIGLMLVSKNRPELRIEKIIHTETQDGKGSIEAHFALNENASTFKKCDHIGRHNEAIFDYEQNSITVFEY